MYVGLKVFHTYIYMDEALSLMRYLFKSETEQIPR